MADNKDYKKAYKRLVLYLKKQKKLQEKKIAAITSGQIEETAMSYIENSRYRVLDRLVIIAEVSATADDTQWSDFMEHYPAVV